MKTRLHCVVYIVLCTIWSGYLIESVYVKCMNSFRIETMLAEQRVHRFPVNKMKKTL
jgi:hypothetical protein